MKKILTIMLTLAALNSAFAQDRPVHDWAYTDKYYDVRNSVTTPPKAIFYGDSITECWGIEDMDFFTERGWLELGVSGMTTCQLLCRFRTDVINLHPKYVVILCGTNDIAQNIGPIEIETAMGNIISMAELAKANRIKPILCSITPCDVYKWNEALGNPSQKIIKFNNLIKDYCKANRIPYVDYHAALDDGQGGMIEAYTKDHCHLTLEGYKVMEKIIIPYIK